MLHSAFPKSLYTKFFSFSQTFIYFYLMQVLICMYLFYHSFLIFTTKSLTNIVSFSIPVFMRTLTRDFSLQEQFVTKAARHCGAIIAPVLFLTFSKETGQKQYGWCKKCDVMRVEMMPFAGLKLCFSDRRPPSLEMSFCSS